MRTHQSDNKIMDLLGVREISRIICDTNMGTLRLRIRKGDTSYHFVLDAVELGANLNKELMELLFPFKEESKSFQEQVKDTILKDNRFILSKNKGGRPKGSKSKFNLSFSGTEGKEVIATNGKKTSKGKTILEATDKVTNNARNS